MPTATADTRARRRARELARLPKPALARLHAANGGQMGVAAYLTWSKPELVAAVLEDEQSAREWDNMEAVRKLLHERQPVFATALEIACAALT